MLPVACLLSATVWAQNSSTLQGRVVTSTGKGIAAASIVCKKCAAFVSTDTAGHFSMAVPAEKVRLQVSAVGHKPVEWTVQGAHYMAPLLIVLADSVLFLPTVDITAQRQGLVGLPEVPQQQVPLLLGGSKNISVPIAALPTNAALKIGRQLTAKVPGAFVYDMDGSGNQLHISMRGLDPHRSWEYNVRQNGIITNSDMFGYPASHYSAPIEAVASMDWVSGTAALQYGAQFGGLLNYQLKQADTSRSFSYEGIHTTGSFGLLSTYHAVGGRVGRLTYQAFAQRRQQQGYRRFSQSSGSNEHLRLQYQASRQLQLEATLSHSTYRHRQPGPLTDSMAAADPRQATRQRNWYSPDIVIPSFTLSWQPAPGWRLQWISSAVLGTRNSVQRLAFANVPDTIIAATGAYRPRQVDIDRFRSFTHEVRLQRQTTLAGKPLQLLAGLQWMHNNMRRRQQGQGTTGTDYDLQLTTGTWGRDLNYRSRHLAGFVSARWQLPQGWSITPGVRVEGGHSQMTGSIVYYNPENLPNRLQRRFATAGLQAEKQGPYGRWYAGISQAYRPTILKDMIPANALERVDSNLLDGRGWQAEIGWSGWLGRSLRLEATAFHLVYRHRMGGVLRTDENGINYLYRTNLGNSATSGLELYAEWVHKGLGNKWQLLAFTATSLMLGRYTAGTVVQNGRNVSIKGNELESVPRLMSKWGLQLLHPLWGTTLQSTYVGRSYSDALNTGRPTANGANGPVPAYTVVDWNAYAKVMKQLTIKAGINNLLNAQYFTKRPQFYPEPGIWPSDGRSVYLTVVVQL